MSVYLTDPLSSTRPLSCPPPALRRSGATPVLLAGGRLHRVGSRTPVVMGSGPEATVLLDVPFVSGRHAAFLSRGQGVSVEDLGSTNGTLLKGRPITRELLDPGSAVLLARSAVLVAETLGSHRYPQGVRWQGMVGRDPLSLRTWERLAAVASTSHPVLLQGPSGSGKEHAAQAIHRLSPRHQGPFVAINCAALPPTLAEAELFGATRGAYTGADRSRKGAFERADGGTLLLDEVGDLPPSVQGKLLRILETGEVQPVGSETAKSIDVRVLSATWRDLASDPMSEAFRLDLLQRLAVLRVELPALRERPRDIGPLLEIFLEEEGAGGLWPDANTLEVLERSPWPGNVRQLRSHARMAAALGSPERLLPGGQAPCSVTELVDPQRLSRVLRRCGDNRSEAARVLGISRSTLYRRLSEERAQRAMTTAG